MERHFVPLRARLLGIHDETRPAAPATRDLEIIVGNLQRIARQSQPLLRKPCLHIIIGDFGADRDAQRLAVVKNRFGIRTAASIPRAIRPKRSTSQARSAPRSKLLLSLPLPTFRRAPLEAPTLAHACAGWTIASRAWVRRAEATARARDWPRCFPRSAGQQGIVEAGPPLRKIDRRG